jgi:hypothetical protein
MKGSLLIWVALILALTIFVSFVHPATFVLASRQAKFPGILQLVALAVFALVVPLSAIHSLDRAINHDVQMRETGGLLKLQHEDVFRSFAIARCKYTRTLLQQFRI